MEFILSHLSSFLGFGAFLILFFTAVVPANACYGQWIFYRTRNGHNINDIERSMVSFAIRTSLLLITTILMLFFCLAYCFVVPKDADSVVLLMGYIIVDFFITTVMFLDRNVLFMRIPTQEEEDLQSKIDCFRT